MYFSINGGSRYLIIDKYNLYLDNVRFLFYFQNTNDILKFLDFAEVRGGHDCR